MTLSSLVLTAGILTFAMILIASVLRTSGNPKLAMGNRDDLPQPSPLADRADRAAKNMIEGMVIFLAVAYAVGTDNSARVQLGAEVFVAARVIYWPLYLVGVKGLRTLVWTASIVGIVMMAITKL